MHLKVDKLLVNTEKEADHVISQDEFSRNNDLDTVKLLLGAFDFDMINEFCCSNPDSINQDIPTCCDIWGFILTSPTYRIYNPELEKLINSVYEPWSKAIELGMYYYFPAEGTNTYRFHRVSYGRFPTKEAEHAYNRLIEFRKEIYPNLKPLSDYIKDHLNLDPKKYAMKGFN